MRATKTDYFYSRSALGFTLIELIVFIVIVGLVVAGMVPLFQMATAGSADPLVEKQAMAFAWSMLEEVQAHPTAALVATGPGAAPAASAACYLGGGNRTACVYATDYNGYNYAPTRPDGTPLFSSTAGAGVSASQAAAYNAYEAQYLINVTVGAPVSTLGSSAALGGTPVTTRLVTVTVTGPGAPGTGPVYSVVGYVQG